MPIPVKYKAMNARHFDFGKSLGEISHVLALGGGRAIVLSRYMRWRVYVEGVDG